MSDSCLHRNLTPTARRSARPSVDDAETVRPPRQGPSSHPCRGGGGGGGGGLPPPPPRGGGGGGGGGLRLPQHTPAGRRAGSLASSARRRVTTAADARRARDAVELEAGVDAYGLLPAYWVQYVSMILIL
eukprot:SAG31_NODE_358_length_17033_cov_11.747077_11_plen_130_part_00